MKMKYYVSVPMIKKNLVSQNVFKVSKQLAVGLVFPGADKTAMYRGPNGLQTACCLFSQENHILGLGGQRGLVHHRQMQLDTWPGL